MKKVKLGRKASLYPGATLIGANVDGKPNFMTISHCGLGAYKPPAVVVALNKFRYTLKGVKQNGTFSVNIPSCDMVKSTDYCGIYSGRKRDKSEIFTTFYGQLKTAPLIEECPLNLECKAIHYLDLGSHILVVGEIVETYLTERCMKDGNLDASEIDPLIYITQGMTYYRLGKAVAPAFDIGKEAVDARSAEAVRADCLRGR